MALDPVLHRRVLFCLRYGIGDVVMELPLIDALRRALPPAELTVLGADPAIELLAGDPRVDRCISLQQLGLSHRWDRGSGPTRRRIERWLREAGFDLVLDTRHAPPAVALPVYATGIARVDSDPETERAAVAAGENAVAAIQAAVAAGWGIEISPEARTPRYDPLPEHRRFSEELLGPEEGSALTIGLAPIASHTLKRWPAERFASLADWLCGSLEADLLLFCGPADPSGRSLLERVADPRRCTLVEALHLGKVSALLARCEIVVANDTGITHLAAAVGTPTIGIFGPTAPHIYRPANEAAVGLVGETIECCHRNEHSLEPPGCWFADQCLLGGPGCIRQVEVAAVQRAVLDVLATVDRKRSVSGGAARPALSSTRPDPW